MMKRNKIVSIVILSVTALACMLVGWLLIKAVLDRSGAAEGRNADYNRLQKIYADAVFPDDANIERIRQDKADVEEWLKKTGELLHEGDLPANNLTPATFKQKLQATVRRLSQQPGVRRGKVVIPGFNFGFDQYLGESDSLPEKEHVPRLDRQLSMIEQISHELYRAKVLAVDSVARETFDSAATVTTAPEESRRRGSRRRSSTADDEPAAAGSAPVQFELPDGLVSKESFTFEFTATPEAYVTALNRLAAMKLFTVVAENSFKKTGDQLAVMEQKPKSAVAAGEAQKAHSQLSYAERTVTNPNTDPPVSVKLVIDVYTFEGV